MSDTVAGLSFFPAFGCASADVLTGDLSRNDFRLSGIGTSVEGLGTAWASEGAAASAGETVGNLRTDGMSPVDAGSDDAAAPFAVI